MSGGSTKREMETGEKATSHRKAPSRESGTKGKEGSPLRVKSHRSGDKKKMKKVVYYETDSSSPSTSDSDAASVTSKRHECKKYSKMPLRYPRISKRAPLLFVPLGKPPYFDGEDYCMWSDNMRHHLTSLHTSIWDIVEFGAQVPTVGARAMTRTRSPKYDTINQTSSHNITNMFGHKHKYPTLKNISLKYLTKHYQHLTSSDQVISQSMNNTKKDNISSRWAAGLVRRWAGRSMRVVRCHPRLSLHKEDIACVIPDALPTSN
jgi:hypothetical protein